MNSVTLRDVTVEDVPVFFVQQDDPEAGRMADFPIRTREAHEAHWQRIRADAGVRAQTILCDGRVAGNIGAFDRDGLRQVGYWLGREFWGRGVATRALALFLALEPTRPLHAYVAAHNTGSIRVLEKNGFVKIRSEFPAADPAGGGATGEEWLMRLDATR